jgi:hypothetical protein
MEQGEQGARALPSSRARQTCPLLAPDVFSLVADQLSPNERTLLLRPLCKEARDVLPDATAVQLSQPVPEAAFAAKWGQPGSMNHLSYWHRHEAMCLTAKSGVLANLRLLVVGPGGPHEVGAAGCGLTCEVMAAAAEAGHLPMCRLLRDSGCPWSGPSLSVFHGDAVEAAAHGGSAHVVLWLRGAGCHEWPALNAAAEAGHAELCKRLVAEGFPWSSSAAGSAARGGHAELMRWLLAQAEQDPHTRSLDRSDLLQGAAAGLDLATLQASELGWGPVTRGSTSWGKAHD